MYNFLSLVGTDMFFFSFLLYVLIPIILPNHPSPHKSQSIYCFMAPNCLGLDPHFATSLLCDLE